MSDTEFGTDEAFEIARDIIKIAMTSVLGDERDKTIRTAIVRHLTPTKGEPAVIKLLTASDVIAILGYTIGALMDDAKGVDVDGETIWGNAD